MREQVRQRFGYCGVHEHDIQKLRLNRPQLRASRAKRRLRNEVYAEITAALARSKELDEREPELTELLNAIISQLQRLQSQ